MDGFLFDDLLRQLSKSRRSLLGTGVAAVLGGGVTSVSAGKGKKNHGKKGKGKKKPTPTCQDAQGRPCDGCCLGKTCVRSSHQTNEACGRGGKACETCNPNVRCDRDRGVCLCDEQSCFGCCSQLKDGYYKRCRTGSDNDACQDGRPPGDPCVDCTKKSPPEVCTESHTCAPCQEGHISCAGSCCPQSDCCLDLGVCCTTGECCGAGLDAFCCQVRGCCA